VKRLSLATGLIFLLAIATTTVSFARDALSTLNAAQSLVDQARTAPEADRPRLLRQAGELLARDPSLVDNAWLREPFDADSPDLGHAQARLGALISALSESASSQVDAIAARADLAEILTSPPIKPVDWLAFLPAWMAPVVRTMLEVLQTVFRVVTWPLERLYELAGKIFDLILLSPLVLVLSVAIGLALILLYRWGIRSAIVAQTEIAPPSGVLPPTAGEAMAGAQRLAAEGQFREACHYVFLSTLLWIEENGTVHFDPTATNREHLARVAATPELVRVLRPVVHRFDQLWYGQESVTVADYRELLSLAGSVRGSSV
jgi:hypothetical protein